MNRSLSAKLLAITGASFAFCMPAEAADLEGGPYRATPPPPVYSWNGVYFGANFGGVFTVEKPKVDAGFLGTPATFNSNPVGALGGLQLGYNLQLGPQWLIGIEGEADWTSSQFTSNINNTIQAGTLTSNQNWFDTLDGRLGYIMGPVLLYAKGGGAWMNAKYTFGAQGAVNGVSEIKANHAGWTVGGGLEAFIMPNWSAKLEYDFLDFGRTSYFVPIYGATAAFHTEAHEVKVGINYHWAYGY